MQNWSIWFCMYYCSFTVLTSKVMGLWCRDVFNGECINRSLNLQQINHADWLFVWPPMIPIHHLSIPLQLTFKHPLHSHFVSPCIEPKFSTQCHARVTHDRFCSASWMPGKPFQTPQGDLPALINVGGRLSAFADNSILCARVTWWWFQ
jgi:hypothetical protein